MVTTYREMNEKIVGILRISDEPDKLYAAQRIEELEDELVARDETIAEMEDTIYILMERE